MSKHIVAVYDDMDTAREVVEELVEAGINRETISLVANNASGQTTTYTSDADYDDEDVSGGEGATFGAVVGGLIGLGTALIPGVGPVLAAGPLAALLMGGAGALAGAATGGIVASLVDMGVPEHEAGLYAESIRRGGAMVSVTASNEHANRVQEIMNSYHPINLDERSSMWQESGWQKFEHNAQPYTSDQIYTEREQYRTLNAGEEERFDIVEEELQVGKREVERGGVRIHSYVTETPVHEQVNLREEHVRVDRHPVNRPASSADLSGFREDVIEVTERAEEAVVNKTARVVEEVVVGKEVQEHTQDINDTVRRTEVEVEGMENQTRRMTGTSFQPYETYEQGFRSHFVNTYGNGNYTWEQVSPAYRYGYDLGSTDTYRGRDWVMMEDEVMTKWEAEHPNTWRDFKDAIRHGWETITFQR